MKKPKTKLMNLKVTPEFSERLNRTAAIIDRPASQIVREAVIEKLEQLARQYPEVRRVIAA